MFTNGIFLHLFRDPDPELWYKPLGSIHDPFRPTKTNVICHMGVSYTLPTSAANLDHIFVC